MKRKVGVKEVWEHTIEVEVPEDASDGQILDAANDYIAENGEGEDEYDYTLGSETWVIYNE